MRESYARFCHLLTLAEKSFLAGDPAVAAGLAQIAARYAFPATAGLFASPRLENLLLQIGKQLPVVPTLFAPKSATGPRHILHVLSYGRPVGGDSRCAWRWMQEDTGSRHSVVLTSQADLAGICPVPEILRMSASNSGGKVHTLKAPTSKPLEQAAELRALCQQADIVVLHLFPYDVVPVLALAAGCNSVKTLFIHHADHTFWAGASVADLIVHLRQQSRSFLMERRGLDPKRSFLLPIPLPQPEFVMSSGEAKAALGYSPETILLLTIASPFKYNAPGQISFLELVLPVLEAHLQAVLIAVGPEPTGAWKQAAAATDGRLRALGTRWDNDILYAAADVYLDSVPFSSITSLLEAGIRGVPLLGYTSSDPELQLLGAGAPGLESAMARPGDSSSYRDLLARLIVDKGYRLECGRRIQSDIFASHTGRNWAEEAEKLYNEVERVDKHGCLLAREDLFRAGSLSSALSRLYERSDARKSIAHHLRGLRYGARVSLVFRLERLGFGFCYRALLPARANQLLRNTARQLKRTLSFALAIRSRRLPAASRI